MKKRYTKKQLTEAITYWTRYLNENVYSHEHELDTAKNLGAVLIKENQNLKTVVIDNVIKSIFDNVIDQISKYNVVFVKRNAIDKYGVIDGSIKNNVLTKSADHTVKYDRFSNKLKHLGVEYIPINCPILLTGNSSHMSDCYAVFKTNQVNVVGLEIKNSLNGILFSVSGKINTHEFNKFIFDNAKSLKNSINTISSGSTFNKPSGSFETSTAYSDDFFKATIRDGIKDISYTRRKLMSGMDNFLSELEWKFKDMNMSFSVINNDSVTYDDIDDQDVSYDLALANAKMLVRKLKYELENSSDKEFMQSVINLFYGQDLSEVFSYKFRYGSASEFISKKYNSTTAKLFNVKISNNDIIKDYFNRSRAASDTYKSVSYIQVGHNMNYNVYKLTDDDPLQFDASSNVKTGNVDDVLFGANVEWSFRSDDKRGNMIRCVGRIYPQLTKRTKVGSILDKTHQLVTSIGKMIQPMNWKNVQSDF